MKLLLRISYAMALGLVGAASGLAQTSTLDVVHGASSVTTGADGRGLIAYVDSILGHLKAAHCDDLVCSSALISTLDSSGDAAWAPSVTIGADGLGLITFWDYANRDLKVAHCDDVVCSSAAIVVLDSAGDVGRDSSVATGADGLALIAYEDDNGDLKVAHCSDVACSSAAISILDSGYRPSVTIGADGLPLISYGSGGVRVAHCSDVACSSATISTVDTGGPSSVTIGADGLGLIIYGHYDSSLAYLRAAHCDTTLCSSATISTPLAVDPPANISVKTGADGLGLISYWSSCPIDVIFCKSGANNVAHCDDVLCSGARANTVAFHFYHLDTSATVTIGADGLGLIAYEDISYGLRVTHCYNALCSPESDLSITKTDQQTTVVPGQPIAYTITVSNAGPDQVVGATVRDVVPAAITGATWTCLAVDGTYGICMASGSGDIDDTVDLAAGGAVTYGLTGSVGASATGSLSNTATVAVPESHFDPNPTNDSATDTDTILPLLSIGDVSLAEGDVGASNAVFPVGLLSASPLPANVHYSTIRGSATPTDDYTPTSGLLDFSPGETSKTISVPVVGDALPEPHETYLVHLYSPTGAVIADGEGIGTILDDDGGGGPGFGLPAELVAGFDQVSSLAAWPGPVAAEHVYLLEQKPYSSYEAVLDEVSGDVQPLEVDRLDADGSTVLQSAQALSGLGASLSMRWSNETSSVVSDQSLRIRSGGCTTDCDPSDTYRLRFYETTGAISRFNNAATQVTVLILENPTDYPISGTIHYWDPTGALLARFPFGVSARQTLVLNTSEVPGVAGQSGSMTVTHDGRYGSLSAKAVGLEPATGFSFDSPMLWRAAR